MAQVGTSTVFIRGLICVTVKGSLILFTVGAIFFAVCRGKVSEGLDFADNFARAVITVSLGFICEVNGDLFQVTTVCFCFLV